jgi:hypothetical protein
MSDIKDCNFLVLAYNYITETSEYDFCRSKLELKRRCSALKKDGFEIMFAGEIEVKEDYTKSMM